MRLTVLDDDPGRKINLGVERYAVFLDGGAASVAKRKNADFGRRDANSDVYHRAS